MFNAGWSGIQCVGKKDGVSFEWSDDCGALIWAGVSPGNLCSKYVQKRPVIFLLIPFRST